MNTLNKLFLKQFLSNWENILEDLQENSTSLKFGFGLKTILMQFFLISLILILTF